MDDIQKVIARLDDLSDLKIQISVMNTVLTGLSDGQKELITTIRGNGKPGLLDRVKDLEVANNNHTVNCPLRGKVDDLVEDKQRREKLQDDIDKERRGMRTTFFVSVTMLIISTLVNILVR